jgi:prepilin-type processing-associated H-X9-DG protein
MTTATPSAPTTSGSGFQYYKPVFNANDPANMKARLRGMLRLGDRWEFENRERLPNQPLVRSSLMAAPRYFQQEPGGRPMSTSHPGESYSVYKLDDEIVAGFKFTLVRWDSYDINRGPIDLNCLFADGSVATYLQVKWENDPRTAMVGEYSDMSDPPVRHELVIKE